MRYTQLRNLTKIERVNVLIQKRRLQWLGHVERMSDERLQKKLLVSKIMNGKRCQGGQKQRWHDLIHADLKQLNMVSDWRTAARDRKQWRNNINKLLHELNAQKELDEKARKDFVKIQKNIANNQTCNIASSNASLSLVCSFPGCNKVAANKTGLANHIRQKHRTQTSVQCKHCGLNFKKQGIYNHRKKCSTNSSSHLPLGGQTH